MKLVVEKIIISTWMTVLKAHIILPKKEHLEVQNEKEQSI